MNAVVDGSGFCLFLQPTLDTSAADGRFLGEEISREEIADLGWQLPAGRVGVQQPRCASMSPTTILPPAFAKRASGRITRSSST